MASHDFSLPTSVAGVADVKVEVLTNDGNEKGEVFNLTLTDYRATDMATFSRTSGLKSPGHFHTGLDTSFDPQVMIIVQGRLLMKFWDLQENEVEHELVAGSLVTIPKFILHDYQVLDDAIFIELRTQPFRGATPDVFFEEEFKQLISEVTL